MISGGRGWAIVAFLSTTNFLLKCCILFSNEININKRHAEEE